MTTVAALFEELEQARQDVIDATAEMHTSKPGSVIHAHRTEVWEEALDRWWAKTREVNHYAAKEGPPQ